VPLSPEGTLLDGRYRVLRHLGSGGMASVLLCQDERLGRQVAVKRLHADSPADVEQRFVREARMGALLNHPNIVAVYDTATDSDGVLIVMEYVAGEALSGTLKRGPLRFERVGLMVRDLGAALDHLHEHGVVHRDVKPGNVLLRKDGVTKLVDLGIATASDQTRITSSGMVLGTATYMAPEQLEGGRAGPATDIYALSVVAYEALTGQRARTGRTPMEIAHRIATEPPPDLRERLPDAPATAARLLEQGMARDPAERPRSAGELSTRLARALEEPATEATRTAPMAASGRVEAPSPPPPPPAPSRLPSPRGSSPGRRPAGAIALALVFLALAAAVAIGAVLSGDDGGEDSGNAQRPGQGEANAENKKRKSVKQKNKEKKGAPQQAAPEQAAPEPAPEQPAPEQATEERATAGDPAQGAELNDRGFTLMQQGNFAGAVPLLEQAVASYPKNSQDIGYAYALFNLGKSLNRSGRPDEAIPILERRLVFPDQRETVEAELDLARANAG
jgi:eukaryotic-like serine/threonine-protein kinase